MLACVNMIPSVAAPSSFVYPPRCSLATHTPSLGCPLPAVSPPGTIQHFHSGEDSITRHAFLFARKYLGVSPAHVSARNKVVHVQISASGRPICVQKSDALLTVEKSPDTIGTVIASCDDLLPLPARQECVPFGSERGTNQAGLLCRPAHPRRARDDVQQRRRRDGRHRLLRTPSFPFLRFVRINFVRVR